MALIRASAPNKLHLAGEHSVVYGGKALMAPAEVGGRRMAVSLEKAKKGFEFSGDLGTSRLENGQKTGSEVYFPCLDVAVFVAEKSGKQIEGIKAVLEFSDAPKGTGNSASISVALALALYAYCGKTPSKMELYEAGFVGDNAIHGGKSSGGDVTAVLSNKIQKFYRVFEDGLPKPVFEELDLQLPKGTELVLIGSHRGGEKATTATLIEQFAKAHGVSKKPAEMSLEERKRVYAPFDQVVEKIQSLCHTDADAKSLGKAFDENHALLSSVTTQDIDAAIQTAKGAGALGGKLIGAGGTGGSLIVLVHSKEAEKVRAAVKQAGFESWPVNLAKKGPSLD